jgi:cytochrome c556
MKTNLLSLLCLLTVSAPAAGAPPPLQLSPSTRTALFEEMQSLARDMQLITAAIPGGEWEKIEQAAKRIRGAFILEQKLSAADREALEKALPDGFLLLDERLHADAEHLAMAAREGHGDAVVFLAARMLDGCVSCHARYATDRFPALKPARESMHRH